MARVGSFLDCEQIIPIAGGLWRVGIDPFENCTARELALVNFSVKNLEGKDEWLTL
jgi:hypothetical protein